METAADLGILGQIVPQDLDGHIPVQPMAPGLVDSSHTADADQLQYFISVIE